MGKNRTRRIDASDYITSSTLTVTSCGNVTGVNSAHLTSVSHTAGSCEYTIDPVNTYEGTTSFTVPYTFSDRSTHNGSVSITIGPDSNIRYNGPFGDPAAARDGIDFSIDAQQWATDGAYEISCTSITAGRGSAATTIYATVGCYAELKFTGVSTDFTLNVGYASSGGATSTQVVRFYTLAPSVAASRITYTAPTNLTLTLGGSTRINARDYAREAYFDYRIFCSSTQAHTDLIVSRHGCTFTVRPKATATTGSKTFEVNYFSTGGFELDSQVITITVVATSDITFTAPTGLTVAKNRTKTINALDYVREADTSYTISCGDATAIDTTELSTVTRNGCNFTITPKNVQGAASFTVPYTSTGGDTHNGVIPITVGPDSTITFTAPPTTGAGSLRVPLNRTLTVDASDYVSETSGSSYTITCGNATAIDTTELSTVTRPDATAKPCEYLVTPKAVQGAASFTVPYTSTGGHSVNGVIPITVIGRSDLRFTAPTNLRVARNITRSVNAGSYARDGSHAITCGDATGVDSSKIASLTHSGSSCTFSLRPVNSAAAEGVTTFTIPYTSAGGDTTNGTISITIGPRTVLSVRRTQFIHVKTGQQAVLDLARLSPDGDYALNCISFSTLNPAPNSVTASRSGCITTFTATITNLSTSRTPIINYQIQSAGSEGSTSRRWQRATLWLRQNGGASGLTYQAPTSLQVRTNSSLTINALSYITETTSAFTISCLNATNRHSNFSSITRRGCNYTVNTGARHGQSTFTVPYRSSGGATRDAVVSVNILSPTQITGEPPTNLSVAAGRSIDIDATDFASVGQGVTLNCLAPAATSPKFSSVTRNGCVYTATAGASSSGNATFNIILSTSTQVRTYTITVTIGPSSDIIFVTPTGLTVATNRTLTIDASSYISENSAYTVTCSDAASIDTVEIATVARNGCSYTVTPTATTGPSSFQITYTSTGGDTHTATISIVVGPASTITFSGPTGLQLGKNRTRVINALDYATESHRGYTITCGNAKSIDTTELQSVVRSPNSCTFTVTPKNVQGAASFIVPYTSAGGHKIDGTINITVGPDSTITYTPPTGLQVGINRTRVINALDYVTEAHNGYTITCGDATGVDSRSFSSVTRADANAKPCEYTLTPTTAQGATSFRIPYTSSGGHTLSGTFPIAIGPSSTITFTAPDPKPEVSSGRNVALNVGSYARDSTYAITCGDPTGVDSSLSIVRVGCNYTVTADANAPAGDVTFTVPYTSAGGHTASGTVTITIIAITFNAPDLEVGRNRTLTIDADDYISEGRSTFSCANATSIDTAKLTSVTRTANTCTFTITPVSTLTEAQQGDATFTVPFTSSSTRTYNGVFTVAVGPDSEISFTSPTSLILQSGAAVKIDAAIWATDGDYTISCSRAQSGEITGGSVGSADDCIYTVTATGAGNLKVAYASSGGHTHTGTIAFTTVSAVGSQVRYTAPTDLFVRSGATVTLDASQYVAADGNFTIFCLDPTRIHSYITVTRTKGCNYAVTGGSTTGASSFYVQYASSGGGGATEGVLITVRVADYIEFERPYRSVRGQNGQQGL